MKKAFLIISVILLINSPAFADRKIWIQQDDGSRQELIITSGQTLKLDNNNRFAIYNEATQRHNSFWEEENRHVEEMAIINNSRRGLPFSNASAVIINRN